MKSQKDAQRINEQRVFAFFRLLILSEQTSALHKMMLDSSKYVVDIWNFINNWQEA